MQRRQFLGIASLGLFVAAAGLRAAAEPAGQRIAVTGRKFEFVPAEIGVKKGQHVTFELTAVDFPHGFAMPDFGIRKDLIPGKLLEISITPDREGRFHYLCDNFCGDGHDRMSGILVVT